jgi:hypothetical protein
MPKASSSISWSVQSVCLVYSVNISQFWLNNRLLLNCCVRRYITYMKVACKLHVTFLNSYSWGCCSTTTALQGPNCFVWLVMHRCLRDFLATWRLTLLPMTELQTLTLMLSTFICHICCDTGPWYIWSHLKDWSPCPTMGFKLTT